MYDRVDATTCDDLRDERAVGDVTDDPFDRIGQRGPADRRRQIIKRDDG